MAIVNIPGINPLGDLIYSLPIGVSPLGTIVIDDIFFKGFPVTKLDDFGNEIQTISPALHLQTVKIMVLQEKTIVKTAISGFNGTVKEYVCDGDYKISVEGKINELFNVFPADQLQSFLDKCKQSGSIEVISKFLNKIFDIDKVDIENYSLSPVVGSINEVDFTLEMTSSVDFDPDLFLVNPSNPYKYRNTRYV